MSERFYHIPLPEIFRPAAELMAQGSPVLLYSLGRVGRQTLALLRERGLAVAAILDADPNLQGTEFEGLSVAAPEAWAGSALPVVVASEAYYEAMIRRLKALGFKNYLPYLGLRCDRELNAETYFETSLALAGLERLSRPGNWAGTGRLTLASLDLVVTERCSLRCRDCSNLMQYFDRPRDADFDQVMAAVARLFELVGHISELRLLGGEPFMNRQLSRYLSALQAYRRQFDYMVIYTNGTIRPRPEEIEALKADNVGLSICDYGLPGQKISEIKALAEKERLLHRLNRAEKWQDCAQLKRFGRSEAENREIFRRCCARELWSLKDGRLFRCPLAGNAAALSAVPPEINQYLDLTALEAEPATLRKQFQSLAELDFLAVCDYCGGRPENLMSIPAAIQAPAPLPYRKY